MIRTNYTYANEVRLIRGGQKYFQLLESLIHQAKWSIYFQIYIFEEDETGRPIAQALMAAAKRKVAVHLLVDAYASNGLSSRFIQELKDAGVKFRKFTAFVKSKKIYVGRRLHHKVIVIDHVKSLVSGLNISNRYNDTIESRAWLDWAVYTKGEASLQLEEVCRRRISDYSGNSSRRAPRHKSDRNKADDCAVRICINDWIGRKVEITRSYLEMVTGASQHMIIMSPYFLPGRRFRKKLRQSSQRGVEIKLILTGVSDVPLAKYGERHLYEWLLKYDIQIYEYQKNILHGKMATCDGQWTTVGSYNVNNLSAYASIELNLEIKNERFAKRAGDALNSIIEDDCIRITKESYKHEINFVKRILQASAYVVLRWMLILFTPKKNREE